jgi:hypothetical protein
MAPTQKEELTHYKGLGSSQTHNSGYGFLGSSLTVFSDDFGSFSGIGQSFNGLMALNVPEPAALAVAMASLVGLAGLLRRRLRG